MNVQQSMVKKSTRSELLLQEIEELIIDGKLKPGERLDEAVLAKKFGVSRTPVREALRGLTAIGLVDNSGRQGAEVSQVSVSMLIEMFEVMAVFEGMCAQFAARRANQDEISEMYSTHQVLEISLKTEITKSFIM